MNITEKDLQSPFLLTSDEEMEPTKYSSLNTGVKWVHWQIEDFNDDKILQISEEYEEPE